jgi:hypothetical protein
LRGKAIAFFSPCFRNNEVKRRVELSLSLTAGAVLAAPARTMVILWITGGAGSGDKLPSLTGLKHLFKGHGIVEPLL